MAQNRGIPTAAQEALQPPDYTPWDLIPLLLGGVGKAGVDTAEAVPEVVDELPALLKNITPRLLEDRKTPTVVGELPSLAQNAASKLSPKVPKLLTNRETEDVSSHLQKLVDMISRQKLQGDPEVGGYRWEQRMINEGDRYDPTKVPGLSYNANPSGTGNYTYRDANLNPIAGAHVTGTDPMFIFGLATDKEKGLLASRASTAIMKELAKRKISSESVAQISPDTYRILQKLAKRYAK